MRHVRAIAIALVAASQACAASAPVESPKPYDIAAQDGYTFEKNEDVKLAREYWTILRGPNDAYALVPRPDGAAPIAEECGRGTALAKRFERASLCRTATSAADVERVNALSREDARAVSSFLHGGLRFRREGQTIVPHPLTSDIIEICKASESLREGELADVCAFEMQHADPGVPRPDIGYVFTERDLEHLPAALNALYGIEARSL